MVKRHHIAPPMRVITANAVLGQLALDLLKRCRIGGTLLALGRVGHRRRNILHRIETIELHSGALALLGEVFGVEAFPEIIVVLV